MNPKIEYKLEYIPAVVIGILTLGLQWFVYYRVYREMTQTNGRIKNLIRIPYSKFKQLFENIEWETDPMYKSSLFPASGVDAYWHADILRIGDTGYILTLYGYIRQIFLKYKIIRRIGFDSKPVSYYNPN